MTDLKYWVLLIFKIMMDLKIQEKVNENKSKSLEPKMKQNRSMSPEKRSIQVPAEILLSSRDQKQNKNDWDKALGMIDDRIHSNNHSLQTIRSFKNQIDETAEQPFDYQSFKIVN